MATFVAACLTAATAATATTAGYPAGYPVLIEGDLSQGRVHDVVSYLTAGGYLEKSKLHKM